MTVTAAINAPSHFQGSAPDWLARLSREICSKMLLCASIMSLGAPAISVSHTAHKCLDLGIVFKFLILLHARCVLDWLHKKLVLVAHCYESCPDGKPPARSQTFRCPVCATWIDTCAAMNIEFLADDLYLLN